MHIFKYMYNIYIAYKVLKANGLIPLTKTKLFLLWYFWKHLVNIKMYTILTVASVTQT